MRHIISAKQFSNKKMLDAVLFLAEQYEGRHCDHLKGHIMASLFYEASTRTRLSFESAMLRMGGTVISSDHAGQFSSAIKGETLEDSIRIIGGYADVIVLRHPDEGAAERAAAVSDVAIINAGDGVGEHPTQAFLDAYTIKRELGHIDDIHVCVAGDLRYGRTVHSLVNLLSERGNVAISLASPDSLELPSSLKTGLRERHVLGGEFYCLEDALRAGPDVLYMTRVQKERFESLALYNEVKDAFVFDESMLSLLKQKAVLMHPLPRVNEIAPAVDADPRAAYFRQARNGLPVRMATLRYAFMPDD